MTTQVSEFFSVLPHGSSAPMLINKAWVAEVRKWTGGPGLSSPVDGSEIYVSDGRSQGRRIQTDTSYATIKALVADGGDDGVFELTEFGSPNPMLIDPGHVLTVEKWAGDGSAVIDGAQLAVRAHDRWITIKTATSYANLLTLQGLTTGVPVFGSFSIP